MRLVQLYQPAVGAEWEASPFIQFEGHDRSEVCRTDVHARRQPPLRELATRQGWEDRDDVRDLRPVPPLMRRHTSRLVALAAAGLVLAAVTSAGVASTAPRPARPLAVVSFNVLAPIWAAPKWYPEDVDPALLEAVFRRARISALLQRLSAATDVFCLQEVQSVRAGCVPAGARSRVRGSDVHERAGLVVELPRSGGSLAAERHCRHLQALLSRHHLDARHRARRRRKPRAGVGGGPSVARGAGCGWRRSISTATGARTA